MIGLQIEGDATSRFGVETHENPEDRAPSRLPNQNQLDARREKALDPKHMAKNLCSVSLIWLGCPGYRFFLFVLFLFLISFCPGPWELLLHKICFTEKKGRSILEKRWHSERGAVIKLPILSPGVGRFQSPKHHFRVVYI